MDLDASDGFAVEYTPTMVMKHIFREIVKAIFMICGMGGDVLIAYIILRFHRMRTVSNLILANWALADLAYLLCSPDTMKLLIVIDQNSLPDEFRCFSFEAQEVFAITINFFYNWMCINWCLGAYWPQNQAKLRKLFKPALVIAWAFAFLWIPVFGVCCIKEIYVVGRHFALWINVLLLIVLLLVINIIRGVQKCRKITPQQSSLMIMIPTTLILTWIALFAILIVSYLMESSFIVLVLYFIFNLALYLNSLIVIGLMFRYHKGFQACFFQTIKCARFRYSDSSLDFNSQESIGSNVTFNSERHPQNNLTV